MSIPDLVVGLLATHRLQSLWFEEIMRPVRDRLLKVKSARLQYLASCPLCISVWSAAVVMGLLWWQYGWFPVGALALSSAALSFDRLVMRLAAPNGISDELRRLNQQISTVILEAK